MERVRSYPIPIIGADIAPAPGTRQVGLCSLQGGGIPLKQLVTEMQEVGLHRIELGCSANHFDVDRALTEPGYCDAVKKTLEDAQIGAISIAGHSFGLPLCAGRPLDPSYRQFVGEYVWGDGNPVNMHIRAADRLKMCAKAAHKLGVEYFKGFCGSPFFGRQMIDFPPRDPDWMEEKWAIAVERITDVLDVFAANNVYFALEAHKGELAWNVETMLELLERLGNHPAFTYNFDNSHLDGQGIESDLAVRALPKNVIHVMHLKGARQRPGGTRSVLSALPMGHEDRGWNYVCVPDGDQDGHLANLISALNDNGLPAESEISIETEDNRRQFWQGIITSLNYIRGRLDFLAPEKSYEDDMKTTE